MPKPTLDDVLEEIKSYVDQDVTATTGIDLNVRTSYVNQAIKMWAGSYDWDELRVTYLPTFSLSGTSFALPDRFSHLYSPVIDLNGSVGDREYVELPSPKDRFTFSSDELKTKKFCYVIGNALVVNPPLASGASLQFDFHQYPASLTTLSDELPMVDSSFVVQKCTSMVLESRSDARFPSVKEDATLSLAQMIERQDSPTGGQEGRVPDWLRKTNFRPGVS